MPILDAFAARRRGAGSRPTLCWSVRVVVHIFWTAQFGPTEYLRSVAGGLAIMVQASLRWADTYGCKIDSVASDAVDGFTESSKNGPMYWWAELLDFGCGVP